MDSLLERIDEIRLKALSAPFLTVFSGQPETEHLYYIHAARCRLVRTLLPPAATICDLGGANSPLFRMGYPHPFDRMVMVDLPDEERHQIYGKFALMPHEGEGQVEILYANMVQLDMLPDESFDLVWSGQSIEHVSEEDGRRMCAEAYRVLKPGGAFCLDTPNGLISRQHAATAGLSFIHPEHKIEYEPAHLAQVLTDAGFEIVERYGVCHMQKTVSTGEFSYADFRDGSPLSTNIPDSYVQYYQCRKPVTADPIVE